MPSHQTVRLSAGRHRSPHAGVCVMELASMLAAERFSDRSATVSPVIGAFLRTYNDGLDDARRQHLLPIAALIVGTAAGRAVEEERVSRCLTFARRLGGALPDGRGALGMATAEAAGTCAALAALAGAPSPERHAEALAFVRELADVRPRRSRRHGRWRRLGGPDAAQAITEALADFGPPAAPSAPESPVARR
jgi:hypothetical protein